MRRYGLVFLALAAAGGCTVGSGSGSATGPLWIVGCLEGENFGSPPPGAPKDFDLNPTFFAGEPIEDIADGPHINRIIIRMQRNGNGVEVNDTLYIDIPDSGKVARCVRGRTVGGVPDYDATTTGSIYTVDPYTTDATGAPVTLPPWCQWTAGATFPRINVVPDGPVRIAFAPLRTCGSRSRPPAFVNVTADGLRGWIDFEYFGGAQQSDVPPEERQAFDADFKVGFGQRLMANFHIELEDHRVITAIREDDLLPQDPRIGGTLDGYFDFNLERGRAAQTFP
jgi:hypothetical protein